MKSHQFRSVLMAPANRHDLIDKFPRFNADCAIIDLEDGTPLAEKEDARATLPGRIVNLRRTNFKGVLGVRINEPWSPGYLKDVEAVCQMDIDLIAVPKLEEAGQLFPLLHGLRMRKGKKDRQVAIMGGIESMRGVSNLRELVKCCPEMSSLYFGAEDFCNDLGAGRTVAGAEVLYARSKVVLYARLAGLVAIDQVVVDVRDDALFRSDASAGKSLGFNGKVCLLPRQVDIAREVFSPSTEEVAYAKRLIKTYEEATRRGVGTIDFEGKMIDGPLLKKAQRMLDASEELDIA